MSHKEVKSEEQSELNITRRSVLGAGAVIAGTGILGSQIIDPLAKTAYAAGTDAPTTLGLQDHRTGIGPLYGRWYARTPTTPAHNINSN